MKKLALILLLLGLTSTSHAMQAVMLFIESARPNGSNVDFSVVVCYSDPLFNNGIPSVEAVQVQNIDPSATISQLQSAFAAAIRIRASVYGFVIPANGVTLIGMSKG